MFGYDESRDLLCSKQIEEHAVDSDGCLCHSGFGWEGEDGWVR